MDESKRTGYRSGVRLPAVSRTLVVLTVVGSLLLAAGGFVLGRSMGEDGTPAAAPVRAVQVGDQPDPIVIPEPLDVPSA
jgi:hypothetical protein